MQVFSTPKQTLRRRAAVDRMLDPALFKALGDPTRVTLLACLAKCGRACSVSELAECCAVDYSVVSRHLALLAKARVLDVHKRGRTVFYRVRFEDVVGRLRALADAIDACDDRSGVDGACCDEGGCDARG